MSTTNDNLSPVSAAELIAWRTGLGLIQAEAAALLPVSLRTYQDWEQARVVRLPAYLRGAMRDGSRRHVEARNAGGAVRTAHGTPGPSTA